MILFRGTLTPEASERIATRRGRTVHRRPARGPKMQLAQVGIFSKLDDRPEELLFSVQDAQFLQFPVPALAVNTFIAGLMMEAKERGYRVDYFDDEAAMTTVFRFTRL